MSLLFGAAATDRLLLPATTINNKHNFTTIQWLMPTTLAVGNNIWDKGLTTGSIKTLFVDNTTNTKLNSIVNCATTNASYITASAILALNTWVFVATTYTDGEKVPRIYFATLGSNGIKLDSGGTLVTGVGATSADITGTWAIGNDNSSPAAAAFKGRIALFAHFSRSLNLGELEKLFYGCMFGYRWFENYMPALLPYCDIWMHLGRNQSLSNTGYQPNDAIFSSPVRGSASVVGTTIAVDPPYQKYFSGNLYDDTDEALAIVSGVTLFNRAKCGVGI